MPEILEIQKPSETISGEKAEEESREEAVELIEDFAARAGLGFDKKHKIKSTDPRIEGKTIPELMKESWSKESLLQYSLSFMPLAVKLTKNHTELVSVFEEFFKIGKQLGLEAKAKEDCQDKYKKSGFFATHMPPDEYKEIKEYLDTL